MRIASCTILAAAFTTLTAAGQSMSPCTPDANLSLSTRVSNDYHPNTSLPYTATIETTFEHKLADGNHIKQTVESIEARNAKGLVVRIVPVSCYTDAAGQPQLSVSVSVYNAEDHSNSTWLTGPGSMALATSSRLAFDSAADYRHFPRTPVPHDASQDANFHHEDLGTQIIAGMAAIGTRSTHTIPANLAGSDLPIETLRDTWVALPSHLNLMSVVDDPRYGKTTWKVTTLAQGDPDPKLFEPPANYATSNVTSTRTTELTAPAKP
jgi:hypothetical protein